MVASPEPLEIIDAPAVQALVEAGFVVSPTAAAGSRSYVDADGALEGVEAVIDKDLGAALLARSIGADVLVIATDVPNAVLRFGTPEAEPVGRVTVAEMRALRRRGPLRQRLHGPEGRRRLPLRRARRRRGPSSPTWTTSSRR